MRIAMDDLLRQVERLDRLEVLVHGSRQATAAHTLNHAFVEKLLEDRQRLVRRSSARRLELEVGAAQQRVTPSKSPPGANGSSTVWWSMYAQ